MSDTRMAQFATSDPTSPDLPFWEQKVYFNGHAVRRRDIVPTLAHTPGMNEATARFILLGAQIVGDHGIACPPAAWFADDAKGEVDSEGRWITVSGNHLHLDRKGEIDAGGPPAVRELLAKRGNGGAPASPDGAASEAESGKALADKLLDAVNRHEPKQGHGAGAVVSLPDVHKLTRDEYRPVGIALGKKYAEGQPEGYHRRVADQNHELAVQRALKNGQDVPAHVLKDYPHLTANKPAAPTGKSESQADREHAIKKEARAAARKDIKANQKRDKDLHDIEHGVGPLAQAVKDWAANKAYLDTNGNYRLRGEKAKGESPDPSVGGPFVSITGKRLDPQTGELKEAVPEHQKNGEWRVEAARYAKGKVAIHVTSPGDFKSGAANLAEALGGKWTSREKAYLLPKTKEDRFTSMVVGGWNANPVSRDLTPPDWVKQDAASGNPQTAVGKKWAEVANANALNERLIHEAVQSGKNDFTEAQAAGAKASDLHKEFTQMATSGKFDRDIGLKGRKASGPKTAAAAAPRDYDKEAEEIVQDHKRMGMTTTLEEAHKLLFKQTPLPKVTPKSLVKDIRTANDGFGKGGGIFDFMGSPAKTGFVGTKFYMAKLPESGAARDTLLKASQEHVAKPSADGPTKQPPYQDILKRTVGEAAGVPASVLGVRPALNKNESDQAHLRDTDGNEMFVDPKFVSSVKALWPDASMHIAIKRSFGYERKSLVFKHAGQPVAMIAGLAG